MLGAPAVFTLWLPLRLFPYQNGLLPSLPAPVHPNLRGRSGRSRGVAAFELEIGKQRVAAECDFLEVCPIHRICQVDGSPPSGADLGTGSIYTIVQQWVLSICAIMVGWHKMGKPAVKLWRIGGSEGRHPQTHSQTPSTSAGVKAQWRKLMKWRSR